MQDTFKERAHWIETQAQLERMLSDLAKQRQIAIDTESNSLFAYQEQVCLIQISTKKKDYLVDPLVNMNLSGLGEIMVEGGIEKIFHAAEYDVICLRRDFGFDFNNLFDTMHAARVLGFEKVGLADMLKNQFGVEQGRSYQKANWGVRPMDADMKTYARYDTHFLIPLRDRLAGQLSGSDQELLAREDFNLLGMSHANDNHQPLYAAVSGYHKLGSRELRVLNELCLWRDETARRLDRPLFKVVGNKALLEAVKSLPKTTAELGSTKGISERMARRYGDEMLAAIRNGREKAPLSLTKRKRPSRAYTNRMDDLGSWRKATAKDFKVQSDIILPRAIMEQIAGSAPARLGELQKEMKLVPWRFEHFGSQIMAVLQKGI